MRCLFSFPPWGVPRAFSAFCGIKHGDSVSVDRRICVPPIGSKLDHQLLQTAREMLEEARDSTDASDDDGASDGDGASDDVVMQDAAGGDDGTSNESSIHQEEASGDVNRLKDAVAEMAAMGYSDDDESGDESDEMDGASKSKNSSGASGKARRRNSIGARQKSHNNCHKQRTVPSMGSPRYCLFPSSKMEPHLEKAAFKIIAGLVNLPVGAEIVSAKIQDRAVIRFTKEGLLNAPGVFARANSASTDDDYNAHVKKRSLLGYGLERNKSLEMSQSAQMTNTNNAFEGPRWGRIVSDCSEAMLEKRKTHLRNWDDLHPRMKSWYRMSLRLLQDVIGSSEASDVDATAVQEYQDQRGLLHDPGSVYSIRSVEYARILLEHKDVIGEARVLGPRVNMSVND